MTDKDNGYEQGDDFESFEEFDINAPAYDNESVNDLDGDFESVPDSDDHGDTVDVLTDTAADADFSFSEDSDFDADFDQGWEDDNDALSAAAYKGAEYDSDGKPQRNWLNIAVVGVLAVAVIGGAAMFFLGGNDNAPQQQVVAQSDDTTMTPASDEVNHSLAQQAISGNGNANMPSLLDNPELLGVTATSNERPDPESKENEIFQALNNQPVIADQDVDDIFAALENIQTLETHQSGRIEDFQEPRPMPQPSDDLGTVNTHDMDFLNNIGSSPSYDAEAPSPRSPAGIDVESLAEPVLQPEPTIDETPAVAMPEPQPVAQQPLVTAPIVTPDVETAKKLDELNARLDQFAARLDSIVTKLDEAPTSRTETSSADLSAMENIIARLEAKINELEKQKSAPAPRAEPKKATAKPAPKRAAAQPARRTVQWDLRGATPDKAFVAERGTQNLRTVSVGDTLPGIGRITSISQQSGRWVVQGANGRITQ